MVKSLFEPLPLAHARQSQDEDKDEDELFGYTAKTPSYSTQHDMELFGLHSPCITTEFSTPYNDSSEEAALFMTQIPSTFAEDALQMWTTAQFQTSSSDPANQRDAEILRSAKIGSRDIETHSLINTVFK